MQMQILTNTYRRRAHARTHAHTLWTLELFRGNVGIHRAHKAIQVDGCRPRRMSLLRFPWLSSIRNSFKLRGLYRRSYFGPRTCGGGITRKHQHGKTCTRHLQSLDDDVLRHILQHHIWVCLNIPDSIERSHLICFTCSTLFLRLYWNIIWQRGRGPLL